MAILPRNRSHQTEVGLHHPLARPLDLSPRLVDLGHSIAEFGRRQAGAVRSWRWLVFSATRYSLLPLQFLNEIGQAFGTQPGRCHLVSKPSREQVQTRSAALGQLSAAGDGCEPLSAQQTELIGERGDCIKARDLSGC